MVQPHALDEWDDDWEGTATQFLDLIAELKSVTAPAGLQLSFDINADLDGPQCPPSCELTYNGETKPLMNHTLDMV